MGDTVLSATWASGTKYTLFSAPAQCISFAKEGAIKQVTVELLSTTASAGTQFRLRFRRGWSNSATGGCLVTVVSAPAIAGTYTDGGEYVTRPSRDALWSWKNANNDPEMWSAGDAKSQAGIYMSLSQIAGGSAARHLRVRVTTSRSWNGG